MISWDRIPGDTVFLSKMTKNGMKNSTKNIYLWKNNIVIHKEKPSEGSKFDLYTELYT